MEGTYTNLFQLKMKKKERCKQGVLNPGSLLLKQVD